VYYPYGFVSGRTILSAESSRARNQAVIQASAILLYGICHYHEGYSQSFPFSPEYWGQPIRVSFVHQVGTGFVSKNRCTSNFVLGCLGEP
jgi:hypothetical protein